MNINELIKEFECNYNWDVTIDSEHGIIILLWDGTCPITFPYNGSNEDLEEIIESIKTLIDFYKR